MDPHTRLVFGQADHIAHHGDDSARHLGSCRGRHRLVREKKRFSFYVFFPAPALTNSLQKKNSVNGEACCVIFSRAVGANPDNRKIPSDCVRMRILKSFCRLLKPDFLSLFKSAILFSIPNPTYESLFQTHQTVMSHQSPHLLYHADP